MVVGPAVLLLTLPLLLLLLLHCLEPAGAVDPISITCQVPAYSISLHEVNVTAESETLLLTEGRCYLACLREGSTYQVCSTASPDW